MLARSALLSMAVGVLGGTMNPISARAEALPDDGPLRATAAPGPRAEARCTSDGDSVWLRGVRIWPGRDPDHPRIVTPLVWSGPGDALAFIAQRGARRLEIVVLVIDRTGVTPLAWPVPVAALPARVLTWVGPTKVAIGPTAFEPRAAVSFLRSR